jgi:D-mannonate dehydratase
LLPKIKEKLQEMEKDGHVTPVKEPTEWVNEMHPVINDTKVRICIDPQDQNKAIR